MLLELTIRDFAIIDELRISWGPGLTVLTGETGAGKSIIVDAVGALLGDRLSADVVRAGRERAVIEAILSLEAGTADTIVAREILAAQDLLDDGEELILSREILRSGRTVARVNGRAVPVGLLQQVGEHLIDVHGQSQHLSLLRPREHLELLDHFAGLTEQRRMVAELYSQRRQLQAERRRLQDEVRAAARERDLLRHEVAEIERADLRVGEEEELQTIRQRLRHAERLRHAAHQALVALQGLDEQRGAVDLLAESSVLLADAGRADAALAPLAEQLERLSAESEELSREIRYYLDGFEADPRQVEDVEARFLAIADLKRKYGESVEGVLDYLQQARARLSTAERGEELLADLDGREQLVRRELAGAALELSRRRGEAVTALSEAVERELQDLNLRGARFSVAQDQRPDGDGVDWPAAGGHIRVAIDATGADRVEFLFSANAGEPPRPLGRIASGGELARVSLALKAALTRADRRGTLIFDEVDVGVGGRSAPVVGQKLWELTHSHQVLCITHMPQVAAFADHHLVVTKRVAENVTKTGVQALTGDERVAELAAMLGGGPGSRAARANADDLLRLAERWKADQLLASRAR